jgi:hypothetical protein
MATHKEIRERKAEAMAMVMDTIRNRGTKVKVNDLYEFFGDVWNTPAYFIQDFKKTVTDEFQVIARKKGGTFAVYTGKPENQVKELIMGGLFPHTYKGRLVNIDDLEQYKAIKPNNWPKMFDSLKDETLELYKRDEVGKPTEYLQVTERGKWKFEQVA